MCVFTEASLTGDYSGHDLGDPGEAHEPDQVVIHYELRHWTVSVEIKMWF